MKSWLESLLLWDEMTAVAYKHMFLFTCKSTALEKIILKSQYFPAAYCGVIEKGGVWTLAIYQWDMDIHYLLFYKI